MARQCTIWTEGTHTVHLFSIKIGRLITGSEVAVCIWWLHFCVRQRGRCGGGWGGGEICHGFTILPKPNNEKSIPLYFTMLFYIVGGKHTQIMSTRSKK